MTKIIKKIKNKNILYSLKSIPKHYIYGNSGDF